MTDDARWSSGGRGGGIHAADLSVGSGRCRGQPLGGYVERSWRAVARHRGSARRGRAGAGRWRRRRARGRGGRCTGRGWCGRLLVRRGRWGLLLLLLLNGDKARGCWRDRWWAVLVEGSVHHGPPGHPGGIPRSGSCPHRRNRARVAHAGAAQRRGVNIVVQRRRRASHVIGDGADDGR